MEGKKFDLIERYLSGKMSAEEEKEFKEEVKNDPQLKQLLREMAYIVHSLREKGKQDDRARLNRVKMDAAGAAKRYKLALVAVWAVIFAVTAAVSVPVFKFVIEPLMEMAMNPSHSKTSHTVLDADSATVVAVSSSQQVQPVKSSVVKEERVRVEEVQEVKKMLREEQVQPVEDVSNKRVVAQVPELGRDTVVVPKQKENRVMTWNSLRNYVFSEVSVKREGAVVRCFFTMCNVVEDASIQMHTARAIDSTGKNYDANQCTLQGRNRRVRESWKKDQPYEIEIAIHDVAEDVTGFQQVSFSFQSDGEQDRQKSTLVVLRIDKLY